MMLILVKNLMTENNKEKDSSKDELNELKAEIEELRTNQEIKKLKTEIESIKKDNQIKTMNQIQKIIYLMTIALRRKSCKNLYSFFNII